MPSTLLVMISFYLMVENAICCFQPKGVALLSPQQLRQDCPLSCRCRCRNNLLRMRCRKIPHFLEPSAAYRSVSLAKINLTSIPQNAFKFLKVTMLDLHGNMLTDTIHQEAFKGLDTLRVLVLSDCQLTRHPVSVAKIQSLEVLRMEYNNLSVIVRNTFSNNTNLVDLSLFNNKIRHIQPGAFAGLGMLNRLQLLGNEIRKIRRKQLKGLSSLRSLDLSRNLIKVLPGKVFKDLKYLQWLDLELNLLTTVKNNIFKGLRRLQYLNLARNPLMQIEDGAFNVIWKLRFLSLEVGNVGSLSNSTFNGLNHLNTLHLGEALHQTFPDAVFGDMKALRRLSVSNYRKTFKGFLPNMFPNRYNFSQLSIWNVPMDGCSCRTKWIRKLTKKAAYVFGYCSNGQPLGCNRNRKARLSLQ